MGFLDRLLGRSKKMASDVGREAGELYDKGRDKVEDTLDRDDETSTGATTSEPSPAAPAPGASGAPAGGQPAPGGTAGAGTPSTTAGDSTGTGGGHSSTSGGGGGGGAS